MKILLVPSAYSPAVGGVEVLTANLAKTLQHRGHDVEVWTYSHNGTSEQSDIDGVVVRRFPFQLPSRSSLGLRSLLGVVSTLKSMRIAAAKFSPDVIHVQCFSGNGAYATALATLIRRPLIVTLQGETIMDDYGIYERSTQLRMALRAGVRLAWATTGCSRFALNDAAERVGTRPRRAEVIYNGVDLAIAEEPVLLPNRPYFAALGRVVRNKGFDLLLDAFHQFAEDDGSTDLVIGGSGTELDSLRELSDRMGIADRVHFVGTLRPGQVAALLRSATALVVPSRVEPFGIVVLEGWRAGIPVIATSSGGPPEFIDDGVNGYVIDPHDTTALAEKLRLFAEDANFRTMIGQAGKARVVNFSWEAIASQYERLYRTACRRVGGNESGPLAGGVPTPGPRGGVGFD